MYARKTSSVSSVRRDEMGTRKRGLVFFVVLGFALILSGSLYGGTAIENGVAYLEGAQNADGSWGTEGHRLVDTYEACYTLIYLGKGQSAAFSSGINWLNGQPDVQNDVIARKIELLSRCGVDVTEPLEKLTAAKNQDGGWGTSKGYRSDALDTLLALRALIASEHDLPVIEGAIDSLVSAQEEDGGWKLQNEDESSIYLTTSIVVTVAQYQVIRGYYPASVSQAMSKASAWLISKQNPDGTWGAPSVEESALGYCALTRTTRPASLLDTLSYIETNQQPDGSWAQNIFKTSLALRTIQDSVVAPVPGPPDLAIAVEDLSFTPENPLTTDTITITAIVHNPGDRTVTNVGVGFYDGNPADGGTQVGETVTLAGINAGGTGTARLACTLGVGMHDLFVVVDPLGAIPETDETNNQASIQIEVDMLFFGKSDLSIKEADLTLTVPDPAIPNGVNMVATVHNLGETTASNVMVIFYDGDPAAGGLQIGPDFRFPSIAAESESTAELYTFLDGGEHNIFAVADPLNLVDEADETNNQISKSVTVTNQAPLAPTGVTAEPRDETVYLTWDVSIEPDLFGYHVFRNGEEIVDLAISGNSYLDRGLRNGATYTYTVVAEDVYGLRSPHSAEAAATPLGELINTPIITQPTNALIPLQTNMTPVTVEGLADVGSTVEVFRDSVSMGTTIATEGVPGVTYTTKADWDGAEKYQVDTELVPDSLILASTGVVSNTATLATATLLEGWSYQGVPENINDGDTSTYHNVFSDPWMGQYPSWQLEWQTPQRIKKIRLWFSSLGSYTGPAGDYNLSYWDGTTWQTPDEWKSYGGFQEYDTWHEFELPVGVTTTKVKMRSGYSYDCVCIGEFEAWGEELYTEGYARLVYDGGMKAVWGSLNWKGETPADTAIKVRTRSASTEAGLAGAAWSLYYERTGGFVLSPSNRWLEVEARLETQDHHVSPTLDELSIGIPSVVFTTRSDWDSGEKHQVNTEIFPGDLALGYIGEIGNIATEATPSLVEGWTYQGSTVNINDGNTSTYDSAYGWNGVTWQLEWPAPKLMRKVRIWFDSGADYDLAPWNYYFSYWDGAAWVSPPEWSSGGGYQAYDTWHEFELAGLVTTTKVQLHCPGFYGPPGTVGEWEVYSMGNFLTSGYDRLTYDAGRILTWGKINWTSLEPDGTNVKCRTRSADTIANLSQAIWSGYYEETGQTITSASNRCIEVEMYLETTDTTKTPRVAEFNFNSALGNFSLPGVELLAGENIITAQADDGTAISEYSDPISVSLFGVIDLAISSGDLTFSLETPMANQVIEMTAVVHNLGTGIARDVTVQFFDGDPAADGLQLGNDVVFEEIGPGGTGTIIAGFTLNPGNHSIYVKVDPLNQIPETSEINNIASKAIEVSEAFLMPGDLKITSDDITFSNPAPFNIETFTITAAVTNVGENALTGVVIDVYDGNPEAGGVKLGKSFVFTRLTPTSTATVNLTTSLTAGNHEIYVVADPANTISEISETNNIASKPITVSLAAVNPPDLRIALSDVTFSNPAPTSADKITITALCYNVGGIEAGNVVMRFYDGDPKQGGAQIGGDLFFAGIGPGDGGKGEVETRLPAGVHTVYVILDPDNTIAEMDEDNNLSYASITVEAAPLPDLAVSPADIVFAIEEPTAGTLVMLTAEIHNMGEGPALDTTVAFYDGLPAAGGYQIGREIMIPEIPVGESDFAVMGWAAAVGTRNIYAVIDPHNTLPELDKNNNQAFRSIVVQPGTPLAPPLPPEVEAALELAVEWLKTQQAANGSFGGFGVGSTALCTLALIHSGLTEEDPAVANGVQYVVDHYPWGGIYDRSMGPILLVATGNKEAYNDMVMDGAQWILSQQSPYYGGWGYGPYEPPDGSNNQFAVLALYAAETWGFEWPQESKDAQIGWLTSGQWADGGWDYGYYYDPWGWGPRGSMTTAAVMALRICGVPLEDDRLVRGINWLDSHFTVSQNPGLGTVWHYYYLWTLERSMSIPFVVDLIGEHDWYGEGSAYLIENQHEDGRWQNPNEGMPYHWVTDAGITAFAMLFLERAVPRPAFPDLTVGTISFSKPDPIQGETITITADINNIDIGPAENVLVAFYDNDPQVGGVKIGEDQIIESVPAKEIVQVSIAWTIATSGHHIIYVIADPDNTVQESREDNNTGTEPIPVIAQKGFELRITTDKPSYVPGETVVPTVTLKNVGLEPASGTGEVVIRDKDGNTVASLRGFEFADLAQGAETSYAKAWKTDPLVAHGGYEAFVTLYQNGLPVATAKSPFTIAAILGIDSDIRTDKQEYSSNEQVTIISKVKSESTNYTYSDVKVQVELADPSLTIVYADERVFDTLLPEALKSYKLYWNTGTSVPGEYTVTQTVLYEDEVECEAQTTFDVISSVEAGKGITGTITVSPDKIRPDETFDMTYSAKNTGNMDLVDITLNKLVVSLKTGETKMTLTEQKTILMGEDYENTIPDISAATLPGGDYWVILQAVIGEQEINIARCFLSVYAIRATIIIKPEALYKNTGVITAFVTFPEEYDVSTITDAMCDGAPHERMNYDAKENRMIMKFRRNQMTELPLDVWFTVRGHFGPEGMMFEGKDDIHKIVNEDEK